MNKVEKTVVYTLSSLTSLVILAATVNLGVALNATATANEAIPDCTEGTKIERFHCGLRYR